MSKILVRVDALANAADIRAARAAASTAIAIDERRELILDAIRRIEAGGRLPRILEDLALGMFITGHLERAADARNDLRELEQSKLALATLEVELRQAIRRSERAQPQPARRSSTGRRAPRLPRRAGTGVAA